MRVVLLGPQRRPTVASAVRSLVGPVGADVTVATVTAGWQEREPEDAEMDALLAGRTVNLGLFRRWLDAMERDPELAAAGLAVREQLEQVQVGYLVRLHHALTAVYELQREVERRPDAAHPMRDARTEAELAVRELDQRHLIRTRSVQQEFWSGWVPHERPVIARHRAEVAHLLAGADVLVVAGGDVRVLMTVLHLFNLAPEVRQPVVAWSAGAMALTERVVLFGERAAQGPGHAEVLVDGLGLAPGVVALPHARSRLRLDDRTRMAVMARRFAPARCVLLDPGARVLVHGDLPPEAQRWAGARVLDETGAVTTEEAA